MAHIGYYRSRRGWRRIKGFRVNSCRLSIHRLHVRFLDFIKLLRKWKSSYGKALKTLKKGIRSSRKRPSADDGSRRGLVGRPDHKLKSYRHSNSFYAEAIADCLEFIKRSAVAIDDDDGSNSPTSPTSSTLGGMG